MFEVNTKNGKGKLVHLAGIRGKSSMGLMTLQGTKKVQQTCSWVIYYSGEPTLDNSSLTCGTPFDLEKKEAKSSLCLAEIH